jgi:hypothetical protein
MNTPQEHSCIDNEKLISNIEKFGWAVLYIEATDYLPSFAYTVGLWRNYNHPELISFGLTTKTLNAILNIGGDLIKSGQNIQVDKVYDNFFDGGRAQFVIVDNRNLNDYFSNAISFNKKNNFPALQLVWTDRKGKFPWNMGFEEEFIFRQPLLDRNANFKFRELKNLGVFTTRQWLDQKKPILRVVHDFDGNWQFLTGDQLQKDARIVCIEELILRDTTLNDTFNLDYGEKAERNFIGDKWIRFRVQDDE